MKYLAELLEASFDWLCVLTGHFGGCWLLNGRHPLSRLHWWAVNRLWDDQPTDTHRACPTCRFDRSEYVTRSRYETELERAATPDAHRFTTVYQIDCATGVARSCNLSNCVGACGISSHMTS